MNYFRIFTQSEYMELTGHANEFPVTWRFGVTISFIQFLEQIFTSQSASEICQDAFKMAQSTIIAHCFCQVDQNTTTGGNSVDSLNQETVPA